MDWLPFPGGSTAVSGVGHFHVPVQVSHGAGDRVADMEALVDTGATYTWIPGDILGASTVDRCARARLVRAPRPAAWLSRRKQLTHGRPERLDAP
jgi:hypothetical protein